MEDLSPDEKYILETMAFLEYKVRSHRCTDEEVQSFCTLLRERLVRYSTTEDIARFYGQSEANVRVMLSRRLPPPNRQPRRMVFHRFDWVQKIVPERWRRRREM